MFKRRQTFFQRRTDRLRLSAQSLLQLLRRGQIVDVDRHMQLAADLHRSAA